MNFTRREMFAGAAGASLLRAPTPRGVTLEAISGERLPHRLTIPASPEHFPDHPSSYYERREYRAAGEAGLDRLHAAFAGGAFPGIRPLFWQRGETLVYVLPFDSLGARAEAWTAFASHPDWVALRESVHTVAVSIYRAASGSAIRGIS